MPSPTEEKCNVSLRSKVWTRRSSSARRACGESAIANYQMVRLSFVLRVFRVSRHFPHVIFLSSIRYVVLTGIQIDGGSDWFALSREFVEYVANPDTDSLVIDLSKLFRYTLLPAESFFHTVLRNSRFCNTYIDNNLHMTNWKRKLGCKCQYKAVVDWCGCSPNDFKLEDFNRLRNTADRNIYFGRKFEPVIDHRIIDRLEEWLYPNRMNKTRGNDMYWQSLYHHADLSPLPDDVLLTLSYSLARLVYRGSQMARENIRLLENTAYFRDNRFVGILIRAKSEDDSPNDQVEALVSMRHNFSTSRSWSGRIRSLSVNTDYDQKEQTFRNFAGGIGPYSSPVLAYEFDAGITVPQNVSVLWIDPHGRLADANHILVEEMTLVIGYNAQISQFVSALVGFLSPQRLVSFSDRAHQAATKRAIDRRYVASVAGCRYGIDSKISLSRNSIVLLENEEDRFRKGQGNNGWSKQRLSRHGRDEQKLVEVGQICNDQRGNDAESK